MGGSGMTEGRSGLGGRTGPDVEQTPPGLTAGSAAKGRWGSVKARRLARALMALGLAALAAAFIVRVDTEARVGRVLVGVTVVELGGLLAIRTRGTIRGLRRSAPAYAFIGAVLLAAGYIGITVAGNPRVEAAVGLISPLKLLAVLAAVVAGVFEEALFRGVLMDRLAAAGRSQVLQVFVSGLVFGCLHFYAFAGLPAALMAQAATTVLGWALAALYLLSGRSLWPCVIAHTLIDAALEPALLLSLIR